MSRTAAAIEAKALANLFLDWSETEGVGVTPLKLQKLLYFCHAEYLLQSGKPLVRETFEAWSYGPVIPSVYAEFKEFSERPITGRATAFSPTLRKRVPVAVDPLSEIAQTIRPMFTLYVPVEAGHLSRMSHVKGGPWDRARAAFAAHKNINREISNELIAQHHRPR